MTNSSRMAPSSSPPNSRPGCQLYLLFFARGSFLIYVSVFFQARKTKQAEQLQVLPWPISPKCLCKTQLPTTQTPELFQPHMAQPELFQGNSGRGRSCTPQPQSPELPLAAGPRSPGPTLSSPLSTCKIFITSQSSTLAEKVNWKLRELMTLKLSIYLGLSPSVGDATTSASLSLSL